MSYPSPRLLLDKYGLRAKKSWGQNFLVDERYLDGIVRVSGAGRADTVIEIGAGLGTLTAKLAEVAGRVIAVERDRDMAHIVRQELGTDARVELCEANALTFDYATAGRRHGEAWDGSPAESRPRAIVVGNLPYQIASQILFRLVDARASLGRIVVMLQLEMAERIAARPGTPEYGALSVMLRMYAEPRLEFKVPAGAFLPPPRVTSAVLSLAPLAAPTRVPVADEALFSRVVHAAFGQRRKVLRNALGSLVESEHVTAALLAADIDGQRRGETLAVEEFARLTNAFHRAATGVG